MIVQQISTELGLSPGYLGKLARTASFRYKKYSIKKRSGGERLIHHPARELKLVQRWLVENILFHLPVHPAATAYRRGSSIRKNAALHANNNYVLRVDFQDFFPSLRRSDIIAVLQRHQETIARLALADEDISFITAIVSREGGLVIGAPSSPVLSNALMFRFDEYCARECLTMGVAYSRYADDLYFSTNSPNVLSELLSKVRAHISQESSPRLQINEKKTVFTSKKRRRVVTGLTLTSDRKISIGRKRKRILKSLVFRLLHEQIAPAQIRELEGWVAYTRSVEPAFVASIERKYHVNLENEFLKRVNRQKSRPVS
ncbi:MAG: retron St85 family RNA-directed DNA polymerase [Terriglobales bacterium]